MGVSHASVETFNRALGAFATEVGWTIEYAALREAALMCRDAITFTPPFEEGGGAGETKQAELAGKRAVERDIRSIFVVRGELVGKTAGAIMLHNIATAARRRNFGEFIAATRAADGITFDAIIPNKIVADSDRLRAYKKAQNFFNHSPGTPAIKTVDELRPIHDRVKSISRKGKTKITTNQGNYNGKFLVASAAKLKAYIKMRQKEVGKLKSGWWNVIMSLPKPKKKGVDQNFGRKGVASYVKKFPGNNFQSVYTSPKAASIRFGNLIGNVGGIADHFTVTSIIYGNAVARMERDTEQMLERDASGFNAGSIQ